MTPQDPAPFLVAHARTAWALHEWSRLLHEATTSVYSERYQRAATTIASSLDAIEAMHELAQVFFAPPPPVKALVLELCADEEIPLFPHMLLGAACALRLRHLLEQAATSDSMDSLDSRDSM